MSPEALFTLATTAITLQFAAFSWRIVREIQLGDERRQTWLPVSDLLILISMCSVVLNCLILPLSGNGSAQLAVTTIATAYVILAAHPINTAAHYRLLSRDGRHKYEMNGRDHPYVTDHEWITILLTAASVAYTLYLTI